MDFIAINKHYRGKEMFNKKMLLSIFVLGLAVSLAGAGTWASLQDTGTDTANTFTAGTLDMKLAGNGDGPDDNVEATWVSPQKFKPGDTFTAELRFSM
jgi:spore coat-associated protein N